MLSGIARIWGPPMTAAEVRVFAVSGKVDVDPEGRTPWRRTGRCMR